MADDQIASEVPEFLGLLADLQMKIDDARKLIKEAEAKVRAGELDTNKGVSLLEVKNHLFLSYLIDLTQYMRLKCGGKSLQNSDIIHRLVEARVFLEKVRPLDQKLKYQVDKMIKLATMGPSSGLRKDPLQFKPNPENLVSKVGFKEGDEDQDGEEGRHAVYVPPKVMAVPYQDTGKRTREQKQEDVARKRALSSSLLKEIREEFQEGPEEISYHVADESQKRKKIHDEEKERQRYEEENFIRLNQRKKKRMGHRMSDGATLGRLTDFDDLAALTGEPTSKRVKKKTFSKHRKRTRTSR